MDKESMKDQRIGVLMGGNSSEREISLKSGTAVLKGLKRCGYKATAIDVGPDLAAKLRRQRIDAAFIHSMAGGERMELSRDCWKLWVYPTPVQGSLGLPWPWTRLL